MTALREGGSDGVLSLEMGHGYEGAPNEVARKTYDFFMDNFGLK